MRWHQMKETKRRGRRGIRIRIACDTSTGHRRLGTTGPKQTVHDTRPVQSGTGGCTTAHTICCDLAGGHGRWRYKLADVRACSRTWSHERFRGGGSQAAPCRRPCAKRSHGARGGGPALPFDRPGVSCGPRARQLGGAHGPLSVCNDLFERWKTKWIEKSTVKSPKVQKYMNPRLDGAGHLSVVKPVPTAPALRKPISNTEPRSARHPVTDASPISDIRPLNVLRRGYNDHCGVGTPRAVLERHVVSADFRRTAAVRACGHATSTAWRCNNQKKNGGYRMGTHTFYTQLQQGNPNVED